MERLIICPAQRSIINECKGLDHSGIGRSFTVNDNHGQPIGTIRSVDILLASDATVLKQMTVWRERNATSFLTQFQPTVERTLKWIQDIMLPDHSRIMFLVEDEKGCRLGQFGLCNISENEAELDNAIRGESGGHPQLFHFVELTVIKFCFEHLGVQRVVGKLFSNNILVIHLHKVVGFSVEKVQSLRKTEAKGEIRFDPVDNPDEANTAIKLFTISLTRQSFYQRHPTLKGVSLLPASVI